MSSLDPKQPNDPSGGTGAAAQPSQTVVKFEKGPAAEVELPTLFGKGYGTYQARPENYVLSFVSHTAVINEDAVDTGTVVVKVPKRSFVLRGPKSSYTRHV